MEIQEREEQAASEAKLTAERCAHNELLRSANLDGVESLAEDMVRLPYLVDTTQLRDADAPWKQAVQVLGDAKWRSQGRFRLLLVQLDVTHPGMGFRFPSGWVLQ